MSEQDAMRAAGIPFSEPVHQTKEEALDRLQARWEARQADLSAKRLPPMGHGQVRVVVTGVKFGGEQILPDKAVTIGTKRIPFRPDALEVSEAVRTAQQELHVRDPMTILRGILLRRQTSWEDRYNQLLLHYEELEALYEESEAWRHQAEVALISVRRAMDEMPDDLAKLVESVR